MTAPHRLSRADARRVAVRAQLLEADRPADLVGLVRHLTFLQLDPTASVAPNADLVAWSRLGAGYAPADLRAALDRRDLVELEALVRPAEDVALFAADMADWPGRGELRPWQWDRIAWVEANDACRRDILARLGASGPLLMRDLPDTCAVPWRSTGWTDGRNVEKLLGAMVARGEVAVAGRQGRERLWDLASRVYPDLPAIPAEEAARQRDERRLRALGIARAKAPEHPMEPQHVGSAGEPAVVEGVKGTWRVDPAYLDAPFAGRTALLSPFDRLVHDRKRALEIFGFEYQLEMYKPAAQRRWGYFALPVLHQDRLVGKIDATGDRAAGVLRVDAVHEDVPFTKAMTAAVRAELRSLARWLGLAPALPG
ncbi:DNA glycosylase AlkZ-like family protein [Kineosporia sp. R_H_3]|uniref:DNA glycosylase AlkZ-like family protein n=1 Tax=Kineosporia sp. R_H_3 TaxID=1961848 RepID=UPI0018E9D4B8|nr:crosslink repair DNA glycosylase YcaQ family protein [Kineosporia sp. R_H_3]